MKAELFLRITWEDSKQKLHEDYYALERIEVDPAHAKLAWKLRKPKENPEDPEEPKEWHTVMVLTSGAVSCDCQWSTYSPGQVCKHRIALLDRGLLPKRTT